MNLDDVHFGEALDELRRYKDVSQKQLAEGIGVSAQSMSETLKSHIVKFETFIRICDFLGTPSYQLLAFMETGVHVKAWSNFERIMNLEEIDKNFVLEGINNSLRFIIEKNKKAVD